MQHNIYHCLSLILLTGLLSSCNKELPQIPDSENPCECATEVTADFTMKEVSGVLSSAFTTETDTIFKGKNVEFHAYEENASYTWYIGTEVINTKDVGRFFAESMAGTDVPISLVVQKEPNNTCFPNDDGYDSIFKVLHVSNFPIENNPDVELGTIEGTYRLKMPHLQDSADMIVDVAIGPQNMWYLNLYNYDGQGSDCVNQALYNDANYREISTSYGTAALTCDYLRGRIHNRLDGIMEMNFEFGSSDVNSPSYYHRVYYGRKLN